jgi:hypothetical protein
MPGERRLKIAEVNRIFLMPEAELFLLFIRPLNRAGIRYVIGGSVAAIFYGEPRFTNDVDSAAEGGVGVVKGSG